MSRVTLALALVCGLLLTGCSGSGDSSTPPTGAPSEATDAGTPLEDVDTTALLVPREPFCDRVDPAAVTRALGEEPADVSAYRSGQRIRISDELADVVHEFGCRWTAGDNSAEAWVFAPPITRERAATMADAAGQPECGDVPGAARFGQPSSSCEYGGGGATVVRYQGLFGDAWLTCSLRWSGPQDPADDDRASRWCAAVATGAARQD
jgi:hypothetical protein